MLSVFLENKAIPFYASLNRRNPFNTDHTSSFTKTLLGSCANCNWVDIESQYYEFLRELIRAPATSAKQEGILKLNGVFKLLIEKLSDYLLSLS